MEEHITKMLEDMFATSEDFADCFVVDVNQTNVRLEIFVDADSGITFPKCQRISRFVEAYLDEEQPLGDKYTLNVSSPGVDRPLKFHRQYVKNVGRNLKVKTTAGEEHEGKMIVADDEAITLEAKVRIKDGKRKKTIVQQTKIAYADINKATVKISF
jgi:ribosome maturation factor RimP